MNLTITDRDLRELHIRRAAAVVAFKRACRVRARTPDKMPLSNLTALRTEIDNAEEDIQVFRQDHLC
ncbi:TPA: hypothetical protein P3R71_003746 [Klebsiella pneumoniae]|uniref:hypothetical protein n=1 Tax=Klebsiella pneumoniae TaxID=573 RepID=UPI0024A8F60E|nr:hypothetical protein [Klebsiella pneumoniae]HDO7154521.1 hypothetical protein [Klebsiella pneumoniae]